MLLIIMANSAKRNNMRGCRNKQSLLNGKKVISYQLLVISYQLLVISY